MRMLRVKAYKFKDKNALTLDKSFPKDAREEDFEDEAYFIFIPVSKVREWNIKLDNTKF